jgi:glyoxylase-like metal-dependent hydrolase (beta-lactamase superfamily II)
MPSGIIAPYLILNGEYPDLRLQHLVDQVYYVPGASNVGLVVGECQQAFLIDTGVGTRSGRMLLQLLQDQGLHLAAILNTHGHGDHVGGNAYLVEQTKALVYAPLHDSVAIQHPIWGTMCLFCGAEPPAGIAVPRFAPAPCAIDQIVTEGPMKIVGVQVQVVPLPGHTGSHTGYIVNGVFFTGDVLAGEVELANAPLSYAYSVTRRLQSLEKLRGYSCQYYVPGHGEVRQDIAALVERNIAQVTSVLDWIKGYLSQRSAEANELLVALCAQYGIVLHNIREYFYWYPIVQSCLSHLSNTGQIRHEVTGNRLLWQIA